MGREEVLMLLAVGDDCLKESLGLYNLRLYRGSINRSYYAIFNVVQALLQSKDILVKTHQGAHVQFYQHFIKTGIFNDEIKKIPGFGGKSKAPMEIVEALRCENLSLKSDIW